MSHNLQSVNQLQKLVSNQLALQSYCNTIEKSEVSEEFVHF